MWPVVGPQKALTAQRGQVLASPTLQDKPQGRPNLTAVRRSLANAWGTELLLGLSREYAIEDELVRIANNWGAVQAYYVAYHAFQAYLVANGEARPESHPKTQAMFADRWVGRQLQMPPWSFGASEGGFLNGPQGRAVDLRVHQWTSCDATNCWDIAGRALKSTRDDAIPDALRKRRENKRKESRRSWERDEKGRIAAGKKLRTMPKFPLPYLTVAEKAAVRKRVRPYTTLDYLFRLRVKSNYEDSTMFTDGPTDENASGLVHRDLVRLASSVLLMHELHIRERVGIPAMTTLIDDWLRGSMPADKQIGLAVRRDIVLAP
jgi:hypothetical protein